MKALFGALESVDEYGKSVDELELEYHEALFEYEEVAAELDEIFEEENEIITAVEQIENLITTIEEHGLSKEMIATINILEPELSKHGIISSTEADSEVIRKLKAVISNESFIVGVAIGVGVYTLMITSINLLLKLIINIDKVATKYLILFKDVTSVDETKLNKVKIKYFNDTNVCNNAFSVGTTVFNANMDNFDEIEKLTNNLIKFSSVEDYVESKDYDKSSQRIEKAHKKHKAVIENNKVSDFLGEVIIPNEANKYKVKFIKDTKFKTTKIPLGDIIKTPKEAINLLNETKDLEKIVRININIENRYHLLFVNFKKIKQMIKKGKKNKTSSAVIADIFRRIYGLLEYNMKITFRLHQRLSKVMKMNMAVCKQLYKCRQK